MYVLLYIDAIAARGEGLGTRLNCACVDRVAILNNAPPN